MRLSLFVTLLVLGVLAGLLVFERSLPELVQEQLVELGFDDLVGFESLELPLEERVIIRGASLRDPGSGERTAWIDRLEIVFDEGLREGRVPLPVALSGRGGRVSLGWNAAGDELGFVTALIALIERIVALIPEGDGPAQPLPEMIFEDLDLSVHAPGLPLTRFQRLRTTIRGADGTVEVLVDPPGAGELRLVFDASGLRLLKVVDMQADPTLIHIIPEVGPFLSQLLNPTGRLDVEVRVDDGAVTVDGTARGLVVRSDYLPVPLGPAVTRFRFADERLFVDEAVVQLDGGRLRASLAGPLDDLRVELDVREAVFKPWILELVPGLRDVDALEFDAGGAFDLALVLDHINTAQDATWPSVEGGGGFHVRRATLKTPGTPLELQDLVGRFEIDDIELLIPRLSARVASGNVTGTGSLQLDTLSYETTLRVEDIDIAPLHPTMHENCTCDLRIAGWLQGEATLFGVLDGESLPNSFGQASIRAGDLWDTPLIEGILLALPDSDGPRGRQRVQASFSTSQDQVTIDSVRIESDLFTLTAENGWVDSRRRIELNGSIFQVPFGVVGKAVKLLADQLLLKVEIRGTVDAPIVTALPLPVVTGPIRSLVRGIGSLFSSDAEEPASVPPDGQ